MNMTTNNMSTQVPIAPAVKKPVTYNIVLKPLAVILLILVLTSLILLSIVKYQNDQMMRLNGATEERGVLIKAFAASSWRLDNEVKNATLSVQNDPNAPGSNNAVLHAVVHKVDPYRPYLVRASKPVLQPIPMGRKLHLTVYGRSRTKSSATIVFEVGHSPYTKNLEQTIRLSPKWKAYEFDLVAMQDYAPAEAQIRLILGAEVGEFDFSGLELKDDLAIPDGGNNP